MDDLPEAGPEVRWEAEWTDDRRVTGFVRLFIEGDSDEETRGQLVKAWTIALFACLDLLTLIHPPRALN